MTLSRIGRLSMALVVSVAMGLGMTSCGGGTIGYMWVLGTQYNNIAGFKIDDYTGNLTTSVGSPYPSGGTNPVMLALKSGGRYLYVLNAGTPNIAQFSVGGDGTLTFQQSFTSQGTDPVWIATDSTGNFLYVLDSKSPDYATTGNGSITAFSLDPNTGRASLITNAAVKDANGAQLTYFEVGANPLQFRYASTGCLYTLDVNSTSQSIFPYVVSSSTGQLTQPTNSAIALSTSNATSVNIGGSYVYVTDAGSTVGGPGSIVPYTQGTSCSLSPVTGGTIANLSTASNPIQTLTDAKNKYVYVLNHSTSNTNYSDSTISAFTIQTTGQLQQLGDTLNPYSVGAGPVCFAEDPTDQYIYTSNQYDGTVTGKILSNITGQLSPLTRGSKFTAVGLPSCLVISSYTGY
jgi:6-phosphogluconolactonase (cycloisomerase 2 family)